jgi:hypothetical protein
MTALSLSRRPFALRTLAVRALAAATLVLGLAAGASAAPPPGMRWSDQAFGRGSSGGSSGRVVTPASSGVVATPAAPSAGTVRWYARPAYTTPAPSLVRVVPPAEPGVWVRGADGVYRWQPTAPPGTEVLVRGADGVYRVVRVAPAAPPAVAPAQPATVTTVPPRPAAGVPAADPVSAPANPPATTPAGNEGGN